MKKIITIENIYRLFRTYGDLDIKVNTPYGFKKINACDITARNSKVIELKTNFGFRLLCSPDHKIKCKNGQFIKSKHLLPGNSIKTIKGNDKVKSLNFLSYTEDLYDIQVEKVEQYYSNGIVSHNSSIFDALSFCLFDKFSRGYRAKDVLNTQKTNFQCKFNFEINGVNFFIERKGQSNKKGDVKVDVKFWKEENGNIIELNGEARRNTNDVIEEYVGSYEDFILTTLSVQNGKNVQSFIDMGQSERKDLLSQFIGLTIFDKLLELSTDESRNLAASLKIYKKEDYESNLQNLSNELSSLTSVSNDDTNQISKLINNRELLNNDILEQTKLIVAVDAKFINVDEVRNVIYNKEQNVKSLKESNIEISDSLLKKENILNGILNEIKKLEDKDISTTYKKYQKSKSELNHIEQTLELKKSDVGNKVKKLDMLKKHKYDPNCKYCVNSVFVKDAVNISGQLENDKLLVKKMLDDRDKINKEVDSLIWSVDAQEQYAILLKKQNEAKDGKINLEKNKETNNTSITKFESEIVELNKNIDDFNKQIEFLKSNQKIQIEIDKIKLEVKNVDFNINQKNKRLSEINGRLIFLNSQIKQLNNNILKSKKLELEYESYALYIKSVNRDGLPYIIMTNIVPEIEREVNNILNQIVEFHLCIETDGKNIIPYIVYDDKRWPIEMASGFEKFISSLAIRVALTNISNLCKMSGLIIDEGWGTMDDENLSQVKMLLGFLKTNFDFIIVISHLDFVKDAVDKMIEINKINGFSHIEYF